MLAANTFVIALFLAYCVQAFPVVLYFHNFIMHNSSIWPAELKSVPIKIGDTFSLSNSVVQILIPKSGHIEGYLGCMLIGGNIGSSLGATVQISLIRNKRFALILMP